MAQQQWIYLETERRSGSYKRRGVIDISDDWQSFSSMMANSGLRVIIRFSDEGEYLIIPDPEIEPYDPDIQAAIDEDDWESEEYFARKYNQ